MVKKITTIAVLISLAAIFSIVDKFLSQALFSIIPFVGFVAPQIKIGIANIVIIYILYNFKFPYCLFAVIMKCVILGFIYGSLFTFVIGFAGSILSILIMEFLKILIKDIKYIPLVSVCGGFAHMLGQILVVSFLYSFTLSEFLLYSPIVLVIGLVSGLFIGIISKKIVSSLDLKKILENN